MKAFPPAYPFLFAFAPILGLFADNYFVTSPIDVLRPLIATTCSVLAGYAFNYILVRNFQKAAVLTLVAIIVIFAYGPVRNILPPDILRTRFYFPIWFAAGAIAYLYAMARLRKAGARLNNLDASIYLVNFASL